jgi:hypothetical protein
VNILQLQNATERAEKVYAWSCPWSNSPLFLGIYRPNLRGLTVKHRDSRPFLSQYATKSTCDYGVEDYPPGGDSPNFNPPNQYFFVKEALVRVNLLTHVWPQKQKIHLWHFSCVGEPDLCSGVNRCKIELSRKSGTFYVFWQQKVSKDNLNSDSYFLISVDAVIQLWRREVGYTG